ncbi:MAG: hypothetical protein L3J92_07795 [Thermoplasmata archaeon]|nr:hypothetical protein [Thermoplasmata archaeon]
MSRLPIFGILFVLVMATFLAPITTASPAPVGAAATASSAAPSSAAPASEGPTTHAAQKCPTPQYLPDWSGPSFFNDVLVSFTVPGMANLSAGNFQTVPCTNFLPTYLPGFWMNISTDVPLVQGTVNIWGTIWPTPNQPLADLPGFPYDGTTITQEPMLISPGTPDLASFYFNTYRFFYPGSTVYFNVTLKSSTATPTTINSATALSQIVPSGTDLNATWAFSLNPPWWSHTSFGSNILVSTTPSVIGGAIYAPNENQSLNVEIQSLGPTGGVGAPIPEAELTLNIMHDGGFDGTYGIPFAASNHSFQNLSSTIGPYPGAEIEFNISAWLPWENGAIDGISSPVYWFNWSAQGGWPSPALGLGANAVITVTPSVVAGATTKLLSATPVNVSVTEPTPNVTISSSILRFHYSDAQGSISGIFPMHLVGQRATYATLPGLPAGGHLTFSVLAKDVFNNPLASGNYSYVENGTSAANLTPFSSFFYVEGINASTDTLLSGASFTVSNSSWSQSAVTTPFGFGVLIIPNGAGTLQLPYGRYTVSMTTLGHTQSTQVTLSSPTPFTVRFWFANGAVSATSDLPLSSLTVGLVAGTAALALAVVPLYRWFEERQKKAEAERTRVTL